MLFELALYLYLCRLEYFVEKNSAGRKGLEGHVGSEFDFEYGSLPSRLDLEFGLLYFPKE